MSSNFAKLKAHIISLSNSNRFHLAKNEWVLKDFELNEEWDKCPCGKDIKELCHLENQLNGNTTYVGNVCVKQFLEIDTGNIFSGLRRINKDIDANANRDLIVHAYECGYIYEKEYQFLMETRLKRNLSEKQIAWKKKINLRILNQTVVRKSRSIS
jgi:hypothetical protein